MGSRVDVAVISGVCSKGEIGEVKVHKSLLKKVVPLLKANKLKSPIRYRTLRII